jgi:hypothetical protein
VRHFALQLGYPQGIAVSPDGLTAWIADKFNHCVAVWTRPDGASTTWTNDVAFGTKGPARINSNLR